ncbi:hypothetical protein MCEMSEM23_00335 [Rhabdaerophilaceae bacterium]
MLIDPEGLSGGIRNLLEDCAQVNPGQSLLILREDPALGYFGTGLAEAVVEAAATFGLCVRIVDVPFSPDVEFLPPGLEDEMRSADHALFLARLGDQLRFKSMPADCKPIVSYILDLPSLASSFGTAPYSGLMRLIKLFNDLFSTARDIHIACALGTDVRGHVRASAAPEPVDVSVRRFPVSIFAPLDASGFSGEVAVAHLLAGTGSRYYQPYGHPLAAPLFARISNGRILGWQGPEDLVQAARSHYAHVAGLFGVDGDVVHSWHAGIHPGCSFPERACESYERWSGMAFGNPRLLHFHTCGDYAPGEICWNVVDPTIHVDGIPIWREGRILIENIPGAVLVLDEFPALRTLFDNPSPHMGLET